MSLHTEVRTRLTTAMKTQNDVERSVMRLILSEVSRMKPISKDFLDDDIKKVVKKLIQANEETLEKMKVGSDNRNRLIDENHILSSLIPVPISRQEILDRLFTSSTPAINEIKRSERDGQAIGVCIKFLKSQNLEFNSDDVKSVVQELRTPTS